MKILVDETHHQIDQGHSVFIVVHVLASDRAIQDFLTWYQNSFLPDSLRFRNKRKVHYTDEDDSIKEQFVELVKDLELTVKVYIWRSIGAYDMSEIVNWSIGFQQETNSESEFFIEQSSNSYDALISEKVHVCSSDVMPELAIADIFAGAYLAKAFTKPNDATASRRFLFLRPRLRLEVERGFDGRVIKRSRAQIMR